MVKMIMHGCNGAMGQVDYKTWQQKTMMQRSWQVLTVQTTEKPVSGIHILAMHVMWKQM